MNILPIPAHDGGHVLFLLYETITSYSIVLGMGFAQWWQAVRLLKETIYIRGVFICRTIISTGYNPQNNSEARFHNHASQQT